MLSVNIWLDSCLICLQEPENHGKMISLDESLLEKLIKCTNFKVSNFQLNSIFPKTICQPCYIDLTVAYKFSVLSEASQKYLETFQETLEKPAEELKENECTTCNKCQDLKFEVNKIEIEKDFSFDEIGSNFTSNEETNLDNNSQQSFSHMNIEIYEEAKRKALERKIQDKHQKFLCDLCGNYYGQHHMKTHMLRHESCKKFQCEICWKKFAVDVDLKRHMRTHTGEKPYECKFCGRKFSDFGSRTKHERLHTGERPYTCKICNKSFMYSYALKTHSRVHTGFKSFVCEICKKGFTKKLYLQNHLAKHNLQKDVLSEENAKEEIILTETFYIELPPNNTNEEI